MDKVDNTRDPSEYFSEYMIKNGKGDQLTDFNQRYTLSDLRAAFIGGMMQALGETENKEIEEESPTQPSCHFPLQAFRAWLADKTKEGYGPPSRTECAEWMWSYAVQHFHLILPGL